MIEKFTQGPFVAYADNGTTKNAIGDYTSTGGGFRVSPGAGQIWAVYRLTLIVAGSGNLTADGYGPKAALTNGVTLQYVSQSSGSAVQSLTGNFPIKSNAEYAGLFYDMAEHVFGSGDNFITGRFTFARSGAPIYLYGASSDYFEVLLQDDFSSMPALTRHTFAFHYMQAGG